MAAVYPTSQGLKTVWNIGGQTFVFPSAQQEDCHRWVYVPTKAEKWITYFNRYIFHLKGDLQGQPFELMPWLEALTRELFGWVDKETGYRRYRESFCFVARKNSKTLFNAGLTTGMLLIDGEKGAECYLAASTEEQAEKTAYGMVVGQILMHKSLEEQGLLQVNDGLHNLLIPKRAYLRVEDANDPNAFIQALSGIPTGKTGYNPHFSLFDEYHEIRDQRLIEAITTGDVQRKQPLISYITTAGDDINGPCGKQYNYALKLREGARINDRYLQMMFFAEEGDDPHSPETWRKANPGLGISVQLDGLKAKHDKAWGMHSGSAGEIAQGGGEDDDVSWDEFLRYHCNIWTTKSSGYVSIKAWEDCKDEALLKQWEGSIGFAGLDVGESDDMDSFGLVFPRLLDEVEDEETKERVIRLSYDLVPWYWVCEAAADASDRTTFAYRKAVANAHSFEIYPGKTSDQDYLEKRIIGINQRLVKSGGKIIECGYDTHNASALANRIHTRKTDRIEMVKIVQSSRNLSEPTKLLRRAVINKHCRHPGCVVLDWNVKNARVIKDRYGEQLSKTQSAGKIDGLAAIVNALRCAIDSPDKINIKKSVYETRGVRSL